MEYTVQPKVKETIQTLTGMEPVLNALGFLREDHENSIAQQLELVQIPAPTFHEEKRAGYMADAFRKLGLTDVHIDRSGNAIGVRKGTGSGPKILIDGHMDTVYPMDTPLNPRRDSDFIYCPGITDDTRALAAMLTLIRALNHADIRTTGDLVFMGSVREEGRGAFGGVTEFFNENKDIDAAVHMDGCGIGGIIYQSTGFKTMEVTFHGIGGHAYGAFGEVANPLHAAARAVAKIADLQVPVMPKTTYCVSNFHAGNDAGIHAIVPSAAIKINYRSNGQAELTALDAEIMRCIREACQEETKRWGKDEITFSIETYCDVPAGSLGQHDPIVEAAWESITYLGAEPWLEEGGPTNASIPISRGIPAVCIGDGGLDTFCHNAAAERFPVKNTWQLPQLAMLVALSVAGVENGTKSIL